MGIPHAEKVMFHDQAVQSVGRSGIFALKKKIEEYHKSICATPAIFYQVIRECISGVCIIVQDGMPYRGN